MNKRFGWHKENSCAAAASLRLPIWLCAHILPPLIICPVNFLNTMNKLQSRQPVSLGFCISQCPCPQACQWLGGRVWKLKKKVSNCCHNIKMNIYRKAALSAVGRVLTLRAKEVSETVTCKSSDRIRGPFYEGWQRPAHEALSVPPSDWFVLMRRNVKKTKRKKKKKKKQQSFFLAVRDGLLFSQVTSLVNMSPWCQ